MKRVGNCISRLVFSGHACSDSMHKSTSITSTTIYNYYTTVVHSSLSTTMRLANLWSQTG